MYCKRNQMNQYFLDDLNISDNSFERLETLGKKHNFTVVVGILPSLIYKWDIYPFEDIHKFVSDEAKNIIFLF